MALRKNKAYIAALDINENEINCHKPKKEVNGIQGDDGQKNKVRASVSNKNPDEVGSSEEKRGKSRAIKRRLSSSEASTSTNLDTSSSSESVDEITRLKSCIEQVSNENFIYDWLTEHISHNISKLRELIRSKHLDIPNFKIIKRDGQKFAKFGNNGTELPYEKFNEIDWSSAAQATRGLLALKFGRETLATHSLTGKPSPAFKEKEAKAMLNPAEVNDIVEVMLAKFKITAREIRSNITTTCADENKMYKNRCEKGKTSDKNERDNDESEAGPSQPKAKRVKKTNQ